MLKELRIKNYAIIDELNIDFKAGLNILTGETGAGKSIIIESLGLILGERASDESIRSGEDSASVEAVFDISQIKKIREILAKSGIDTEDNEIIIKRQISRSGKNRSYINGNAINLSSLKDIGNMLVDIHGQHEHQTLLHPENHSTVLDLFGNTMHLREKCKENYSNLQNLQREVNELINKERERVQKIDLLNFEKLNSVITNITEINKIDSSAGKILDDGKEALFEIEDVASRIRDYTGKIEFNPDRLSEIDDRLAEITALKRKYGTNIEDVLSYRKKIDEELEILSKSQERMDGLNAEIEKLKKDLEIIATGLASEREKASDKFESMIEKELKELKMEKVRFKVNFFYESPHSPPSLDHPSPLLQKEGIKGRSEWGAVGGGIFINYKGKPVRLFPEGIGKIEFFFSPNIGEDLKPLSKIASGGELSRVMLSIKNILTNKDSIPVLIFDEVDAGIGGGVAEIVGEKLKKVSKGRQVFCITHLPQIASRADSHFQIAKKTSNNRTVTSIKELKGEERVEEIARMAGGKVITDTVRRHAEEMIIKGGEI